jgi:iron(III) transport system substrate-binding protein
MKIRQIFAWSMALLALMTACNTASDKNTDSDSTATAEAVVNVYTHRHYDVDKQLFKKFEEQTGIKVNVVEAGADELINKLETEGKNSPADVLITVDAGRLYRAKEKGLLQAVSSEYLEKNVPKTFKDSDNQWFALTYRARVIVYDKEKVDPKTLSTYEALANPEWKGKVLIRSSDNIYNQSLLASMISSVGTEKATEWAKGVVANMARAPKGNDRDQVKAIAAGEGVLAVVNTYYLGGMLNSEVEEERKAAEKVGIFFPNQNDRGTHINISGAGVTKYAPNRDNALKFIEFLLSDEAQEVFAQANYEYPIKPGVEKAELLKTWGDFKADITSFEEMGKRNKEAVMVFDAAQWK